MNILYGVCGEGFGHSSRASEIIAHLEKKGHKVLVITYGQAYEVLKKYNTVKVHGLKLYFNKHEISYIKTIKKSLALIYSNIKNSSKLMKTINKFSPDICISDMEPIVPIIRYWKKIPLISIDNQHRLTHLKINIPRKYRRDFIIARKIVNYFVGRANHFLILSFTKNKAKSENVTVVNPLLRKNILKLKPKEGKQILVYVTKKNDRIISALKKIDENFIVYGYEKIKRDGNINFKKFGKEFSKDLQKCKGIIGTSGFTLISESLFLKKPYFAMPMKGQFEQNLNALFLKDSGFGTYSESPSLEEMKEFIKLIPQYRKKLNEYKSNPYEALEKLDRILLKIENSSINH